MTRVGERMNKTIATLLIVIGALSLLEVADAQQAIFLVRHAEDQRSEKDRPLSDAERKRALLLASLLKDAGIKTIFTSSLQRTIDTAAPLAKALQIEPKVLSQLTTTFKQSDLDAFADLLRTQHREDIVLFVGHANTVPALLKALKHPGEIKIPETDFDNLFVLFPKSDGPPTVLRLHY
jgi:broad specificity phosphatase PhoE